MAQSVKGGVSIHRRLLFFVFCLTVKGQQCNEGKRIVASVVNSSLSNNKQTFLRSVVKRLRIIFSVLIKVMSRNSV